MSEPIAYNEPHRPQFHFTPRKNWMNDPNGLVYYKGEYHLFFQHNPDGINWGSMTWGHAVSRDLVRWTQLDHAIYPDELGTIFSGSAVVDWDNTAGFESGGEKTIIAIYTSAGSCVEPKRPFTQSIAWSNDRGRTWTKYAGNPVLGHIVAENRDPKVVWHAPTKKWVMALYLSGNDYAMFGSKNLKEWERLCDVRMPGDAECPDFFELPVDGDARKTKWVFWGASGTYQVGSFDGTTFRPETDSLVSELGANGYAAQTYSDIPAANGRCIQIAWLRSMYISGMPFHQQMAFPTELTLRTTPAGVRLFRRPGREIEMLHSKKHEWRSETLRPGSDLLAGIAGDLFDVRANVRPRGASFEINIGGHAIRYDAAREELICPGFNKWRAPLRMIDGGLTLQILVDRTSIEIFGNDGEVSMTYFAMPDHSRPPLSMTAAGGEVDIRELVVHELNSAWGGA